MLIEIWKSVWDYFGGADGRGSLDGGTMFLSRK
jgi:hypothetical protein